MCKQHALRIAWTIARSIAFLDFRVLRWTFTYDWKCVNTTYRVPLFCPLPASRKGLRLTLRSALFGEGGRDWRPWLKRHYRNKTVFYGENKKMRQGPVYYTRCNDDWRCIFLLNGNNNLSQCMRFPTMWYVRPAKPQISLRIRAVWSEPLIVAWVFNDC